MPTITITELPVTDDSSLDPVWDQIAAIVELADLEVYGHTDLCDPASVLKANYRMQVDNHKVVLVARAGQDGPVVGYARVAMPLNDNRDLAQLGVWVHPDQRRQGIGTRLQHDSERLLRAAGRTRVTGWTGHRDEAADDDPEALPAPTGVGQLSRRDPVVGFALARGYVLEQTERHSQLDLPMSAETAEPLQDKAMASSEGYRVITWMGATPPEHLDGMVVLHTRMSTDVPMGALAFEEEVWDADRIRRSESNEVALGLFGYQACAQHVGSGELVAYTRLVASEHKPEVAYQEDTLVRSDHRGHRLGMLIKIANVQQLAADRPEVRRVHTWNAGENEWMLAINVAMGFRRATTEGAWQKQLG